MRIHHLKLLCVLLETVGIGALFLPFFDGESFWRKLVTIWHNEISGWQYSIDFFWFIELPFFLAPFVCLQTLRLFFPQPLNKRELWFGSGLVVLLALVPLGWMAVHPERDTQWKWILIQVLYCGMAVLAAGLLLMLKRKGVSAQFLSPLSLRCAYIPNAVFCLLALRFITWEQPDQLEPGWVCAGATVGLYLVEIAHLTRQGLKTRPVG